MPCRFPVPYISTDLVYLRARWYDPARGRFLQRDSFTGGPTRPQSLNRYAYTENNPVNWTDPSGRCVFVGADTVACAAAAYWLAGRGAHRRGNRRAL